MDAALQHVILGDTTPSDLRLVPGLEAYYSTKDPADITTATGVQLWADKSGKSNTNGLIVTAAAGGYECYLTTGTAIGTGAFTLSCRIVTPPALIAGTVLCFGPNATNNARQSIFDLQANGAINYGIYDVTGAQYRYDALAAGTLAANTEYGITFTRSGTTVLCYVNGLLVAAATTNNVSAAPPAYSDTVDSTMTKVAFFNNTAATPCFMKWARAYSAALDATGVLADYNGTVQANNIVSVDFTAQAKLATSFVCGTGQTVTIATVGAGGATGIRIAGARDFYQGTATNQPAYDSATQTITGDGVDNYIKTAPFPLVQPIWICGVMQQVTWTDTDAIFDGFAAASGSVIQSTTTPQINLTAGSSVAANTGLAVGATAILTAVISGADSLLQVNAGQPTTGNAGAGNMNGLTLFASGTPALYANALCKEYAVFSRKPSEADRLRVIKFFARRCNISLT